MISYHATGPIARLLPSGGNSNKGTLDAVTRWVATHAEGLAEWMKNIRRQYQPDRAAVADYHRVATLLLRVARLQHSQSARSPDAGDLVVKMN